MAAEGSGWRDLGKQQVRVFLTFRPTGESVE